MNSLTTYEKWYGRNDPPPDFRKLTAGPYKLEFENGDLRYLKYSGQELIRRIYVAIRDVNWNTIPAKISNLVVEPKEDRFHIEFDASHHDRNLRFVWHAEIDGREDGIIEYSMDGTAQSDFRYCRIGFCVLHPLEGIAGSTYTAQTAEGEISGILPELIEPQWIVDGFETAIFPACTSFTVYTPTGVSITTDFEGDLFETEDQRNWTDGSFKTYCTPIQLGYPHNAVKGQPFYQKVTVRIGATEPGRISTTVPVVNSDRVIVRKASQQLIPDIGFGIQDQFLEIEQLQKELLINLKPSHLKAELHLQDQDWPFELERISDISIQLGSPLELVLFISDNSQGDLEELKKKISSISLARLIVFHEDEAPVGTTSPEWMNLVRDSLTPVLQEVKIYGGTNGNFAELNRQQPDITTMDGVAYTINPQVHAFDERSLVENIEGQHDTVITARSYSGDLPITVSAVTLKPPFNQAATEAEESSDPGELPPAVDQRQMSLFGAAWTIGSLHSLISAGVDSLTYYQISGWLGLMETGRGNPLPDKFRSYPGMVFPLYYVFEYLAGFHGSQLVGIDIENRLSTAALSFVIDGWLKIAASNLLPESNSILLSGFPDGQVFIRRLNENSFDLAASNPAGFLESTQQLQIVNGTMELSLLPYETVFIDIRNENN